jgi:hypothetical protein
VRGGRSRARGPPLLRGATRVGSGGVSRPKGPRPTCRRHGSLASPSHPTRVGSTGCRHDPGNDPLFSTLGLTNPKGSFSQTHFPQGSRHVPRRPRRGPVPPPLYPCWFQNLQESNHGCASKTPRFERGIVHLRGIYRKHRSTHLGNLPSETKPQTTQQTFEDVRDSFLIWSLNPTPFDPAASKHSCCSWRLALAY